MALDNVFRVLSIAIWIAVIWRGLLARGLSELWWACVLLGITATLTISTTVEWFDTVTGHLWLSALVPNLAAVTAATLVVRWQIRVTHLLDPPRGQQRALVVVLVAVLGVLSLTWFGASLSTPAQPGIRWIPSALLNSSPMAAHWLIFYSFILATTISFTTAASRETRVLPPGELRLSLRMLIAAGVCLSGWAAFGVIRRVGALLGHPVIVADLTDVLLVVFFVLFLTGVTLPLLRRKHQRGEPGAVAADVTKLWNWIVPTSPADAGDLFPALIEIRDRMWVLQQWVTHDQLSAAAGLARRLGLIGTSARAFTAAVCLQMAMSAAQSGLAHAADPADLSQLGGGRSPVQEAHWLAAIARARGDHDIAAAAAKIFYHSSTRAAEG